MQDPGRRGRSTVVLLLALTGASWAVLMRASFHTLYVEPTDEAVARAAAARPPGIAAAVLLVMFALVASAVAGRRWVTVLTLPGVLAGGWLVCAPDAHGAAFFSGLAGSLLALVVAATKASASVRRRTS